MVYPRVGGGTTTWGQHITEAQGLSPRGRGNHPYAYPTIAVKRSIPAWAGEPNPSSLPSRSAAVYPRVGGGTCGWTAAPSGHCGLSPRGRGNLVPILRPESRLWSIPAWAGEPVRLELHQQPYLGLSPRGRGNLCNDREAVRPGRSIPAWAGEPGPSNPTRNAARVYPRVGGGTPIIFFICCRTKGLSPRGRG